MSEGTKYGKIDMQLTEADVRRIVQEELRKIFPLPVPVSPQPFMPSPPDWYGLNKQDKTNCLFDSIPPEDRMKPKQVILVRTDIEMPCGKIASQVAHASLGAILNMMKKEWHPDASNFFNWSLHLHEKSPEYLWLAEDFTKIVLDCPSLEEMLFIEHEAQKVGMNYCRITDNGDTVFNGVHTVTTMAIGPHWSENINKLTGHLKTLR